MISNSMVSYRDSDSEEDYNNGRFNFEDQIRDAQLKACFKEPSTGRFYSNTGQIEQPRVNPKRITTSEMILDTYSFAKDAHRDRIHMNKISTMTFRPHLQAVTTSSKYKPVLPVIDSSRRLFPLLQQLWSVMEQLGMSHFTAYMILRSG